MVKGRSKEEQKVKERNGTYRRSMVMVVLVTVGMWLVTVVTWQTDAGA